MREGRREFFGALASCRRLFALCGFFSVFVNLLMLTGPLFMLQVYDRVLASRSEATLVALSLMAAFLFAVGGVLDHARGRLLSRAGARLEAVLEERVLRAALGRAVDPAWRSRPARGLGDLETLGSFLSSPGPLAVFDAPWTPVFVLVLFFFHWLLGALAVCAGALLVAVAVFNQVLTGRLRRESGEGAVAAGHFVEQARLGGETVSGLGMTGAVAARARGLRRQAAGIALRAADRGGLFSSLSRTLRLLLQSMMLALGAWLAIAGEGDAGRHDRRFHPSGPGVGSGRPAGGSLDGFPAGFAGRPWRDAGP